MRSNFMEQIVLVMICAAAFMLQGCGGGGGGNSNPGQNGGIYLPKTGQVISYGTGSNDDGALRNGAEWPTPPRFTAMSSGTGTVVTDKLTGIEWAGDGGTPTFIGATSTCTGGKFLWQGALDYVACLNTNNYLGHNDWRLPNRKELRSLANYGEINITVWLNAQGFSNVQTIDYWSSSTWAPDTTYAWIERMDTGSVYVRGKIYYSSYAWPVRSGAAPAPSEVPQSGQVTSYGANDDGALQRGHAWMSPRFAGLSSGTGTIVADKLTHLEWAGDGGTPTVVSALTCTGGALVWQDALNYVACLNTNNYLGKSDWRLPNINELESLVNVGKADLSGWLISQGFSNVQADYYWSSSTWAANDTFAWYVYVAGAGDTGAYDKVTKFQVWPVRTGQQ